MDSRQLDAFWQTIKIMNQISVLPYVMVIGSWAEFLYTFYFNSDYSPNIRTRDVDFLYPNIRRPSNPINLESAMINAGYTVARDTQTEVVKMFKEDLLEVEFLTRQIGSGENLYLDIPSIGIRSQALRDVNILAQYPLLISANTFYINVPEPAVYAVQKIIINPHRVPASKRAKDIEAVRNILPYIEKSKRDLDVLANVVSKCTKKEQIVIQNICEKYSIVLPTN